MSKITTTNPSVQLVNGRATTTSKQVAEVFGKQHGHVLRDIETLCSELPQEALSNFGEGCSGLIKKDTSIGLLLT